MPREFTVEISGTIATASGDYDLVEITPASGKLIEVLNVEWGQITELGDSADEELDLSLIRGGLTTGNGTSTSPRTKEAGNSISSTFETLATTPASGSGNTLWHGSGKVILPGPIWTPLPQGAGFFVGGSDLMVLRLNAATADDITVKATLTGLEYG